MAGNNGHHAPSEFPPPVDSVGEFIKRGLDDEDELIEVGVAIVGGGTAGLACANRLLQLLGDDLFATSTERLAHGISTGVANAVLVKPNQAGTLTEAKAALDAARAAALIAEVL